MNVKTLISAAVAALAVAAPAFADGGLPQPPAGTPANGFATQDNGCLGGLRSAIARGELAGVVTPSGVVLPAGFSGAFNPGDHFGTVAEGTFLTQVLGIPENQLAAFCASFK